MKVVYYSRNNKKSDDRCVHNSKSYDDQHKIISYLGKNQEEKEVYCISGNINKTFIKILENIMDEILEDQDIHFISF